MTERQKDQIREAIDLHAMRDSATCNTIRDLLESWLDDSPSWVFGSHRGDNVGAGTIVLGITALYPGTLVPVLIAIRRDLFVGDSARLSRAVLHEAAHLSGRDEAGAQLVDMACPVERPDP